MRYQGDGYISGMRFVGDGFLNGVPMRDLTEEEVKLYGRDLLSASGLYVDIEKSEVSYGNQSVKKNTMR